MKLNEYNTLVAYSGGSGADVGYSTVLSGATFRSDMSYVDDYDTVDWSPVFNLDRLKQFNMVLGYKSVVTPDIKNSLAIGNRVNPTSSNTLQLGWVNQKVCLLDAPYIRYDKRDVSQVSNLDSTSEYLEFINELSPIKYNLALREEELDKVAPFPHPLNQPAKPQTIDYMVEADNGDKVLDSVAYNSVLDAYNNKNIKYKQYIEDVIATHNMRKTLYPTLVNNVPGELRYGVDHDSLQAALSKLNDDLNPILDHTKDLEGYAVKYLRSGYLEVPLINAVKELTKLIAQLRIEVDELRVDVDDIELRVGVLEDRIDKSDLSMIEVREALGLPAL